MRWAAKRDAVERVIIDGLEKLGVRVWQTEFPADLLVLFWSGRYQTFLWTPAEVKSPTKTGKILKDKRQVEQLKFLAETHCPVWTSLDDAIAWMREN